MRHCSPRYDQLKDRAIEAQNPVLLPSLSSSRRRSPTSSARSRQTAPAFEEIGIKYRPDIDKLAATAELTP